MDKVCKAYDSRNYAEAIREIMALADEANRFIDREAPWVLAKQEGTEEKLQAVCTQGLNLYKALITYLSPVLPELYAKSQEFLNHPLPFNEAGSPLLGHIINSFKPLFARIDPKAVEAMLEDSKQDLKAQAAKTPAKAEAKNAPGDSTETEENGFIPLAPEITIDDFMKLDLRVGTVLSAEEVEGARKLLKLKVDIGLGVRQVFAGIKSAYKPEELVGRQIILVANLKPRQMKFGLSEGMIMAAGEGGADIFVLSPDTGAKNGDKVH